MGRTRHRAQRTKGRAEAGLGRMLLVSLAIHAAALVLFSGVFLPRFERERRPVYYVDLVNLPVMAPQAGRPDARPEKVEPAPVAKKPAVPAPVKKAPPKVAPPVKKTPVQPKPAPAKKVSVPEERYEETLSAIEQLKRKREIDELKERLAALGSADTRRGAPEAAPVGMPEGKGTEAGTSYDAWLHTFLKQAWTLSKYQVSRRDLEATVHLVFDPRGRLLDYRFLEKSGEERFDDSVRRAVLQLQTLPTEPGRRMEKEVVFNLKELLE